MLSTLAADPSIALVLVTHRQDEIEQLGFGNVLRLEVAGAERERERDLCSGAVGEEARSRRRGKTHEAEN